MNKKMYRRWKQWLVAPCALLTLTLAVQPALAAAPVPTADLGEVVVTALPLEDYLVTTSVITAADMQRRGVRNVAEALSTVAGLHLTAGGKKNNVGVDMRGINASDVKIYIDGVLINPLAKMTSAAAVDVAAIPTGNIEKIEVIKGPAPVIYGSDAKGGVILITTKTGKQHPGMTISVAAGTWGSKEIRAGLGGADAGKQYYVAAGFTDSEGWRDTHRDSRYLQAQLKWLLTDTSSLTFRGDYSLTNKDCYNAQDPATGGILSTKGGFWPGLNNWEYRDWERINLNVDYVNKVSKRQDYQLKLYRVIETQGLWADGRNWDPRVPFNPAKSGFSRSRWNASYWDSKLVGAELATHYTINDKHILTLGTIQDRLNWKKSNSLTSDPNDYGWDEFKNRRQGYYLQDQFFPNERTDITVGLRYDSYDVDFAGRNKEDSSFNPTINAVYRLNDKNTLRASYGKTYSFPSPEQLFGSMNGNPDLQPEKGENYELGLKHVFSDSLQGDVALFRTDITDKIDRIGKRKPWQNLTWAKIRGVEVELKKQINSNWQSFLNYTYLDTSAQLADGSVTELTYTPKQHINYGVSYQNEKGYRMELTGHWLDERYTADTGEGDTRTGGAARKYTYLPAYHLMDMRLSKQVNSNQEWYIAIYNVFDKQYEESLFYPAPGRAFMVGTNLKF